ncbi:MAG: CDP-alcohol phosphatidyltransferase family protein [Myxococcales bacterium]|nr:CDP-alcohol phosphatidyltransferase family protein [Myxococcales bacterium]
MFAEIRRIYRQSLKPADSYFNLYLARPLAAPLVAAFARTRVTPNQVTFLSITVALAAMVPLVWLPGPLGLWLGVAGIELAYVLDCVDGQLARLTGRTSPVGGELDFLMDELKAYLLVAAVAARWHLHDGGGALALFVGLATLVVIGAALSLTRFVRTPEYAEATGTERQRHGTSAGAARQRRSPLWPVEMLARLISQYPACLPIFAVVDRLDVFLYAYGAVHLLYVGRTALVLLLRLGRFAPPGSGRPR